MSIFAERVRLKARPAVGRIFALALLLLLTFSGAGRAQQSKEYQLKAAFLFNFVQFVKWPPSAFSSSDAPFAIGILGDDPFGSVLDETVRGESIDHHKLTIVRASSIEELKNCQLIFVSQSENSHLPDILSQLASRPVLMVGEGSSFTRSGGDIDLLLSGGKVRFEINPAATQKHGLKVSSQLMSLGKVVSTEGGG